jgi:hypothetical protein
MFKCIIIFLSKKQPTKKQSHWFNEDFKKGYKNAWIDNLKDYNP